MITRLNILNRTFICVVFLFFSNQLRAEGSIYFRCVVGVNEYLLSESDGGNVSYVNLKNGYINFVLQESADEDTFHLASAPMAGGGQTRIKFSNHGYDYYLYEITHRIDDGYFFKQGVAVVKNGKIISNKECANDDSTVQKAAYDALLRGDYEYNLSFE